MTSAQLQYYENWGKPEHIVDEFELLGILPHTKPNAIGLWPNEQLCLVWSALQCNPNEIWVEVGSFCGGSTILLGLAKESIDGDREKPVIAIDANFNPMFDLNIKRSKLKNIAKISSDSRTALSPKFFEGPVGFAFLDGWHSFSMVVQEFELLLPHLSDNALIGFHDVSPRMYKHNHGYLGEINNYVLRNYNALINSGESLEKQDFLIDEAVAHICIRYNYEIVDIPVRDNKTYFNETGLNEWVRGRTSPFNAFTAIRKKQ